MSFGHLDVKSFHIATPIKGVVNTESIDYGISGLREAICGA
jgi:hypothetical protein